MENENQEPQEDFITVPKGTTVAKEKYEREAEKAKQAQARISELEEKIAALTTDKDDSANVISKLKEEVSASAETYANQQAEWEKKFAAQETTNALLKAGCIDTESGIASLHEGMTIEQLKEAKPHLFTQPTKPSSLDPKSAKTDEDVFSDTMRNALGL